MWTLASRRWLSFSQSPSLKPCRQPLLLPAQLPSPAILQEQKASPWGNFMRRNHGQAFQPTIVSAKDTLSRSPANSPSVQLWGGWRSCAAHSFWHHCAGWVLACHEHPEELHTHALHRGDLQKTRSKAVALAPNLSHWEARAWQCSHNSPEEKFGKKPTFQSHKGKVLRIIFIQDSLNLFLTIALEAGVCDGSLWRPTIRKRQIKQPVQTSTGLRV